VPRTTSARHERAAVGVPHVLLSSLSAPVTRKLTRLTATVMTKIRIEIAEPSPYAKPPWDRKASL
jgi:hypothetical protein